MSVHSSDQESAFMSAEHSTPMKCPHCGANAHLMRMAPAGQQREQRTFECEYCLQQTNVTVTT